MLEIQRKTTIHVKLNSYLYFHGTRDHQIDYQALFFMATYRPYGNKFQSLTGMVGTFIGDNFLGANFLGIIFLGAAFKGTISERGTFIGG